MNEFGVRKKKIGVQYSRTLIVCFHNSKMPTTLPTIVFFSHKATAFTNLRKLLTSSHKRRQQHYPLLCCIYFVVPRLGHDVQLHRKRTIYRAVCRTAFLVMSVWVDGHLLGVVSYVSTQRSNRWRQHGGVNGTQKQRLRVSFSDFEIRLSVHQHDGRVDQTNAVDVRILKHQIRNPVKIIEQHDHKELSCKLHVVKSKTINDMFHMHSSSRLTWK